MKFKIQSQDPTEIYASDAGYCCITQANGLEDPTIILIAPRYVDEICEMLQSVKQEAIENLKHIPAEEGE